MKVLYVTTSPTPDARVVLADLLWLEPELDIRTVEGADRALTEIRSAGDYGALFIAPSVQHKEALGLIASLRGDRNPIAVVALVTEDDRPFIRTAITGGADDVLVLRGKRLIASLHRVFLRQLVSTLARQGARKSQGPAAQLPGPSVAAEAEIERLKAALAAAERRISALSESAQGATAALAALRVEHDHLRESEAFERALRDRDREDLANLMRELREERDRRVVLAGTLTQTEDDAWAKRTALQEDVAAAADVADRLHQVAHHTQSIQTQLERELVERVGERERLMDNALIGYAVLTRDGQIVRCSNTFAAILGYSDAAEAIEASARGTFAGMADHLQVLAQLDQGAAVDRFESTLRRADGRPVHVLTSATLVPAAAGDEPMVERLVVDLTDQATAEIELRLARRLEAAGRLAAEMASEIETAAAAVEREGNSTPARRELTLLVRQLVAFSRQQAKPAGFLSLNDAIRRAEPALRQIASGAVDIHIELGNIESVTAGEDDLEHLLLDVVGTAAGCLPFGGRLTLTTSSETDSTFVLRTTLAVTAAGYGVLPCMTTPSLVRHTARCGGSLRISGEAGRSSTLHVHLPC